MASRLTIKSATLVFDWENGYNELKLTFNETDTEVVTNELVQKLTVLGLGLVFIGEELAPDLHDVGGPGEPCVVAGLSDSDPILQCYLYFKESIENGTFVDGAEIPREVYL